MAGNEAILCQLMGIGKVGQETDGGGNWNGCCLELEGIMGLKNLATAPPQPSKTLFCLISRAYIVPTQTKNGLQPKL